MLCLQYIFAYPRTTVEECSEEYRNDSLLVIGNEHIELEVVDSYQEREKGLSGRACLPADKGMLFIFDSPGNYGFWMKDMNFALDIIWLDESKSVIHIEKNLEPNTYPRVFNPNNQAKYVIELVAHKTSELGITIGSKVTF